MPEIVLNTLIHSTPEICFDLSRSVDLHLISTSDTQELAIAGVTKGLLNLGDWVTWQARHLGIRQRLTSKITVFDRPHHFRDEQIKGPFASLRHDHFFVTTEEGTMVREVFAWQSPIGPLGRVADLIFLKRHLHRLLSHRNEVIKEFAESEKWKLILAKTNK